MYRLFFCVCLGGFFSPLMAQRHKANWSQVEKFGSMIQRFRNDLSLYPRFINNTDRFWYKMRTDEGVKYYLVDPGKCSETELFDMSDMLSQMA